MALPQGCDHQELVKPLLEEQVSWEDWKCLPAVKEGAHVMESPVASVGVGAWAW